MGDVNFFTPKRRGEKVIILFSPFRFGMRASDLQLTTSYR